MNTPILRVMHALDDGFNAQEYAKDLLVAEILFTELPTDTTELSVRIFSSNYQLIGSDVWQNPLKKKKRKIRLNICSEKTWEVGDYYVFVYRNGRPLWFASLFLGYAYEKWEKVPLQILEEDPDKQYFAEELCFCEWWMKIYQLRYKTEFLQEIIWKLRLHAEKKKPSPYWLVIYKDDKGWAFPYYYLSRHFEGPINNNCVFSLQELVSGAISWEDMDFEICQHKTILIDVPELTYNSRTVNMLSLFTSLLKSGYFQDITFIFRGSEKSVNALRMECEQMDALFTEEQTLHAQAEKIRKNSDMLDQQNDEDFESEENGTAEQQLKHMVGLQRLKQDIEETRIMALFLKERKELYLELQSENRHHMLFLGNPGTGKTTVAQLVGQMYHHMGLLSKGHTVITCRTNLVGEYIGHTEKRMKEVLEEARGGVLFIDEAYTLTSCTHDSNDYGKEVIHALLTVLSEPNPDMIIILAGYEDKMKELLRTNPGLKDRFPLHFHFDDYTSDELLEIAHRTLKARNFSLTQEADKYLKELIEKASAQRDEHFGNGRWVHNLIEQGLIKSMAKRVMSRPSPSCSGRELFSTIELSDVKEAERSFLSNREVVKYTSHLPRIGFRA